MIFEVNLVTFEVKLGFAGFALIHNRSITRVRVRVRVSVRIRVRVRVIGLARFALIHN